ncbi:conserved hypothetical protein [Ricinus communis]|uniref:Uncharacterized protein n=1 Tax=Ricinus communis TaxID=3988 RepID=B9SGL6_RICCO|nr:conserved hypothetical protein [Ricinus communis]
MDRSSKADYCYGIFKVYDGTTVLLSGNDLNLILLKSVLMLQNLITQILLDLVWFCVTGLGNGGAKNVLSHGSFTRREAEAMGVHEALSWIKDLQLSHGVLKMDLLVMLEMFSAC